MSENGDLVYEITQVAEWFHKADDSNAAPGGANGGGIETIVASDRDRLRECARIWWRRAFKLGIGSYRSPLPSGAKLRIQKTSRARNWKSVVNNVALRLSPDKTLLAVLIDGSITIYRISESAISRVLTTLAPVNVTDLLLLNDKALLVLEDGVLRPLDIVSGAFEGAFKASRADSEGTDGSKIIHVFLDQNCQLAAVNKNRIVTRSHSGGSYCLTRTEGSILHCASYRGRVVLTLEAPAPRKPNKPTYLLVADGQEVGLSEMPCLVDVSGDWIAVMDEAWTVSVFEKMNLRTRVTLAEENAGNLYLSKGVNAKQRSRRNPSCLTIWDDQLVVLWETGAVSIVSIQNGENTHIQLTTELVGFIPASGERALLLGTSEMQYHPEAQNARSSRGPLFLVTKAKKEALLNEKVRRHQFDIAWELCRHFALSPQPIFKEQWLLSPDDLEVCREIEDKEWVIRSVLLLRTNKTTFQKLARYGLELADGLLPHNGCKESHLLRLRAALRDLSFRLDTYNLLDIEKPVWDFVRSLMRRNALNIAAEAEFEALEVVFRRHPKVTSNVVLEALSKIPNRIDPYVYAEILPGVTPKDEAHPLYLLPADPEPMHEIGEPEPYVRLVNELLCVPEEAPDRLITKTTGSHFEAHELTSWYLNRAIAFVFLYGSVPFAINLLTIAREKGVPELAEFHEKLQLYSNYASVVTSPPDYETFASMSSAQIIESVVVSAVDFDKAKATFLAKYVASNPEAEGTMEGVVRDLATGSNLERVTLILNAVRKPHRLARAAISASEDPCDLGRHGRTLAGVLPHEDPLQMQLEAFYACREYGVHMTVAELSKITKSIYKQLDVVRRIRVALLGDVSISWRAVFQDLTIIQGHITPDIPFATYESIFLDALIHHREVSAMNNFINLADEPVRQPNFLKLLRGSNTSSLDDISLLTLYEGMRKFKQNPTVTETMELVEAVHEIQEKAGKQLDFTVKEVLNSTEREVFVIRMLQSSPGAVQDPDRLKRIMAKLRPLDVPMAWLLVLQACISICVTENLTDAGILYARMVVNTVVSELSEQGCIRPDLGAIAVTTLKTTAQWRELDVNERLTIASAGEYVQSCMIQSAVRERPLTDFDGIFRESFEMAAVSEIVAHCGQPSGDQVTCPKTWASRCVGELPDSSELPSVKTCFQPRVTATALQNVDELRTWAFTSEAPRRSNFDVIVEGISSALTGRIQDGSSGKPKNHSDMDTLQIRMAGHRISPQYSDTLKLSNTLWIHDKFLALSYVSSFDDDQLTREFFKGVCDPEKVDVNILYLAAFKNMAALRKLECPHDPLEELMTMSVEGLLEKWQREMRSEGKDYESCDPKALAYWRHTFQTANQLVQTVQKRKEAEKFSMLKRWGNFNEERFQSEVTYRTSAVVRAVKKVKSIRETIRLMEIAEDFHLTNDAGLVLDLLYHSLCTLQLEYREDWEEYLEHASGYVADLWAEDFHVFLGEKILDHIDGRRHWNLLLYWEVIAAACKRRGEKRNFRKRLSGHWVALLEVVTRLDIDVKLFVQAIEQGNEEAFGLIATVVINDENLLDYVQVLGKALPIAMILNRSLRLKPTQERLKSILNYHALRHFLQRGASAAQENERHFQRMLMQLQTPEALALVDQFVFPSKGERDVDIAIILLDGLDEFRKWEEDGTINSLKLQVILNWRDSLSENGVKIGTFEWAHKVWQRNDPSSLDLLCWLAKEYHIHVGTVAQMCEYHKFVLDGLPGRKLLPVPLQVADLLETLVLQFADSGQFEDVKRVIQEVCDPETLAMEHAPWELDECVRQAVMRLLSLQRSGRLKVDDESLSAELEAALASQPVNIRHDRIRSLVQEEIGFELINEPGSYAALYKTANKDNVELLIRVVVELAREESFNWKEQFQLGSLWLAVIQFCAADRTDLLLVIYSKLRRSVHIDDEQAQVIWTMFTEKAKEQSDPTLFRILNLMSSSELCVEHTIGSIGARAILSQAGDPDLRWLAAVVISRVRGYTDEFDDTPLELIDLLVGDSAIIMESDDALKVLDRCLVDLLLDALAVLDVDDQAASLDSLKIPGTSQLKVGYRMTLEAENLRPQLADLQDELRSVFPSEYSEPVLTDPDLFFHHDCDRRSFVRQVAEWYLRCCL